VKSHGYYLGVLPYFYFPVLPLALGTVYRAKRAERMPSEVIFPLCAAAVILAILGISSEAREIYALPLLLPLSLLAPPSVSALTARTTVLLERIVVPLFGLLSAGLWLCWFALWVGAPAVIAQPLREFAPAYVPRLNGPTLAAAAYTFLWAIISRRRKASPDGPSLLFRWAAGVTMAWGIAMTLWLPMIESGKTYRGVIADLRVALPARYEHIGSRNLGEPQRALLDYFAGIRTRRQEITDLASCDFLIVQGTPRQTIDPGPSWREIWEGSRAGDTKERFRLFQRVETKKEGVKVIDMKTFTARPTALAESVRATRSP
jgi:hypothetical protein